MNAPKTYSQWLKSEKERLKEILGGQLEKEDLDGCSPQVWMSQEVMPYVGNGGQLPLSVCRSIAKHGGGLSLQQLKKFYEKSLPKYVNFENGKLI